MKKFLIVLMVLFFAISLLGAEKVLRVLMPIGGGYTIEDQEAIAKEFEKDNPGVKIEMEFVGWDELWNKIITSIGAGAAPDVMYIGSRWIPALAEMGAIIPLDDYVSPEKKALYYDTVWDTVTYKGKIWGIVRAMSTKVFIYNKKLFEENNVPIPKTWDELLEAARKIYNPSKGIYGIAMAGKKFVSTVTQFQQYLYANDGRIVDENGKVTINNNNAVEALNFYVKLSKYAQPGILEWKREDLIKLFETGKVGMYIDHVHNALKAIEKGIDVGFFMIPGGPSSTKPFSTVIVTDSIAISSQCKDKELAIKFMEYMTSFEKQAEWDLKLGFVPPMIKEKDLQEFQKWYWKPYIDAIKYGYPEAVNIKDWEGVQEVVLDAIHSVLLGVSDAQTALNQAAKVIEILQK
ncbi:MAG: multiple sugar transport system substrate-binding protein [Thermosipho sp. (in: thermotogales)]|nr:multiple sugar transport system substrate-binding protein [Thermosipho sp. (in: thermotogales)]MDN5325099.1 multiple sugar transport system substrate-binding protein [Thermosipho sp. (in: thermotogales)]